MEKRTKKRLGEMIICADCGKPTPRKSSNQLVCLSCRKARAAACAAEYHRRQGEKRLSSPLPKKSPDARHRRSRKAAGSPATLARCPMCRTMHLVKGLEKPENGTTPWIYCAACRERVAAVSADITAYSVGHF